MTGTANKKSRILASLTVVSVGSLIFGAAQANALSIGAYAVANHSSCGAGNIPGTIAELDKFFASADLPNDFQRNFYWKDARVRQSEWTKDGDYKASTEAASGFDGSDASLLTYIASHGVTSGGVYKALSGSKNSGGCYIPTSSLELGNNGSRYTILSTCQGLKIGTGDNPTAAGENPTRTWKNSAKGLNCILGYSNNMADADQYGEYLLTNIKKGTSTLAKSFLDASESVSPDNIPAVLCYGASEQDAAEYIETNTDFDAESRPNTASAWVYRVINPNARTASVKQSIPSVIKITPKKFNAEKIAKTFLGNTLLKSSVGTLQNFEGASGNLSYNSKLGLLDLTSNLIDDVKNEKVPSATESEKIADYALKISGLSKIAGDIALVAVAEDVLGGEQGIVRIIARKFTYKQNLAGAFPLSQQGSIDVTVGAGGVITGIKAALVDLDSSYKAGNRPTGLNTRLESIEDTVLLHVATKAPGANYRVIKQRIGYDTGNFHKVNGIAPAVVEVTVEASQGEFTRNFVEKVAL